MKTNLQATAIIDKLYDFFWVYFDQKTASVVKKHPDRAIPLIKEAIQAGTLTKPKLTAYSDAMKSAVVYQSLLMKL